MLRLYFRFFEIAATEGCGDASQDTEQKKISFHI